MNAEQWQFTQTLLACSLEDQPDLLTYKRNVQREQVGSITVLARLLLRQYVSEHPLGWLMKALKVQRSARKMTSAMLKQLSLFISVRKLRNDLNKDYMSAREGKTPNSKQFLHLLEKVTTKAKDQ